MPPQRVPPWAPRAPSPANAVRAAKSSSPRPDPASPLTPHRTAVTETGPITYRDAGVDIAAQDAALSAAKDAVRATFTPGVLSDMGLFGGLFDLAKAGCEGHVLVASADGSRARVPATACLQT